MFVRSCGGRAEMKRTESHGNTFPKFRPQDPSLRDEFNDGWLTHFTQRKVTNLMIHRFFQHLGHMSKKFLSFRKIKFVLVAVTGPLFNESDPGPPIVLLSHPRLVRAAAISLPSFLGECPVIEPVTRATLQMAPRTDVVCYKPRCLQFPNINVFWLSLFAVSWLWAEEEANTDNSSSDIRQHVLKAIHKYLHINGKYHLMMCEV